MIVKMLTSAHVVISVEPILTVIVTSALLALTESTATVAQFDWVAKIFRSIF